MERDPQIVRHSSYTPPHLRKKGNASRNGSATVEKGKQCSAMRKHTNRFIHQSASALEKMKDYPAFKEMTDRIKGNK